MTFAAATLGLSLGILGAAPAVDVALIARGEVAGGLLPVLATEPATPALQTSLDVASGLRFFSLRDTLLFRIGPRVLYLAPNVAEFDRPLVFGVASLSYERRLSRALRLSLVAGGGAGELSYASVVRTFAPGSGVVDARVIPLATASATSGLDWQASRLHSLGWSVSGAVQEPLGGTPDAPPPLPQLRTLETAFTSGHIVSPVDTVTARFGFDAFDSDRGNLYAGRASLSWSRTLDVGSRASLGLGGDANHAPSTGATFVFPSGSVEYEASDGNSDRTWTIRSTAGVRGFLDRLNFVYVPQAFATVALTIAWSSRSSSTWSSFASTSLTGAPAAVGAFETFLGLDFEHRHALASGLGLVGGLRSVLRQGHLTAFDSNSQGQVLVFTGIEWGAGTDRENGRFMR